MSRKTSLIKLIIIHFLPSIRGFIYNRNISFISFRAKVVGKLKLGLKTRIFPYVYLSGNINIGKFCSVHEFSYLSGDINIGNYCRIASGVKMYAQNHSFKKNKLIHNQPRDKGVIYIADDVWIGTNAVILKDVKIGKGAIIGAGAIVTKSVPSYEIWAGNPAKKIGERK